MLAGTQLLLEAWGRRYKVQPASHSMLGRYSTIRALGYYGTLGYSMVLRY
jgi:hypothetical protein